MLAVIAWRVVSVCVGQGNVVLTTRAIEHRHSGIALPIGQQITPGFGSPVLIAGSAMLCSVCVCGPTGMCVWISAAPQLDWELGRGLMQSKTMRVPAAKNGINLDWWSLSSNLLATHR